MNVKIVDMIPEGKNEIQMYYRIDDGDLTTLLLEKNDIVNIQTIKNVLEGLLKGKEYINQSFDI